MNWPRLTAAILALGLHGALLFALFTRIAHDPLALAAGDGTDRFTVVASVTLEAGDLFTQSAQNAAIEAPASTARPQERREEELPKPDMQTADTPPLPMPEERPKEDTERPAETAQQPPPPDRQPAAVTQPASAASAAQDEQQAAAALAAQRDKLWSAYQIELHAAVERSKIKVQAMRAAVVKVEATIAPSGQLLSQSIAESSGIAELDRAAIASVRRAAPFPAIPPEVSLNPLTVIIPFEYRVR
jgi:protein TonB